MPLVPQEQRLEALKAVGISEPLRRLSAGELSHPLLSFRCLVPPGHGYHGAVELPPEPTFLPLWDGHGTMTGVWSAPDGGGLQFVRIDLEAPLDPQVLSRTEQGLWATLFLELYEDHGLLERSEFRNLAATVGFVHVELLFDAYEAVDHGTWANHNAFLDEIIPQIDALAAPR